MSEQQLVSIVRRYLPSQQTISWAEGLATIGFGAAEILLEGHTSRGGSVVIERANRQRKTARRIQVTIIKKEHNGMIYYVQTVKLD